jgi:HK97 family phage major capsid protein
MFIKITENDLKNYRYITSEDIETAKTSETDFTEVEANKLEALRHQENQARLAREFVAQTKDLAVERKNEDALTEFSRYLEATGDHLSALNTFLYLNPKFRAELNAEIADEKARIDYCTTAALAGKQEYKRYVREAEKYTRAVITTADTPGLANTIQTTVAQSIIYRAEAYGQVIPLLAKVNVPYGDYQEPFYNKYSLAGYLTETGTVPDIQPDLNDATNGIKSVKWTPRDFALALEQSFRTVKKLSPSILNNIFEFVSIALTSGMEWQALSGPGTGLTDSGMITVATSVTFNTNAYLTFVDACSLIGSKNVRNKVAFCNDRAWGEFMKLAVINIAYSSVIDAKNKTINGIKVVVVPESAMPTTANVTSVVVGDPNHYLIATAGELSEYVLDSPKTLNRITAYHILRDGRARFADSFAKLSLTVS